MPELAHAPYSYREDPGMPAFDDSRALFVFDGACVLCSGGAAFVMRHDRHARVNFTPARSNFGQALYRHYADDWNAFLVPLLPDPLTDWLAPQMRQNRA
jgi:hypothetical protein